MTHVSRPTLNGTFGMVSSTHWLASSSAMAVLERGGNAFDAAVAAGLVLQVVEPHLNGPGGDLPAICAVAGEGRARVLAGQGPAPAAATPKAFHSLGLDMVPGTGVLAATVPGAFDAWMLLLRDQGTMRLREVASYALDYAGHGHPLSVGAATTIAQSADTFWREWPTSAAIWLRGGQPPAAGSRFTNKRWAATLERLITEGEAASRDRVEQIQATRHAWSAGFVAEAIDEFLHTGPRVSGPESSGFVTGDDMVNWSASWEAPTLRTWQGYEVAKTGPWGQGPVLLETLGLVEALCGDSVPDCSDPDGVHLVTECFKLAFADREAWIGDSIDAPLDVLLSKAYCAERARLVGQTASHELRPGSPHGLTPRIPEMVASAEIMSTIDVVGQAGEPTVDTKGKTRGDTVHLDVVDRWGNMISATPSGGWLQSSPAIGVLGFCLGTRLQMSWLEQGLASSLVPGKRPRTTLTPTLVYQGGEPVLACGTPGGDQQDQWQALFLLRHLGQGLTLQEAIEAPTWHTESFPSSFFPRRMSPRTLVVEDRLGPDAIGRLEKRGHSVRRLGPWSLGRMCAVERDPDTGLMSAGANPRGEGYGYAVGR